MSLLLVASAVGELSESAYIVITQRIAYHLHSGGQSCNGAAGEICASKEDNRKQRERVPESFRISCSFRRVVSAGLPEERGDARIKVLSWSPSWKSRQGGRKRDSTEVRNRPNGGLKANEIFQRTLELARVPRN